MEADPWKDDDWECIISLNLLKNERDKYILKKMDIQPGILDLLRCLPMSARLGVRRDVQRVQEFYSLISRSKVILEKVSVDLTALAILTGYKFHSKNMTAIGVQVMEILLNKVASTGYDAWGLRWRSQLL